LKYRTIPKEIASTLAPVDALQSALRRDQKAKWSVVAAINSGIRNEKWLAAATGKGVRDCR